MKGNQKSPVAVAAAAPGRHSLHPDHKHLRSLLQRERRALVCERDRLRLSRGFPVACPLSAALPYQAALELKDRSFGDGLGGALAKCCEDCVVRLAGDPVVRRLKLARPEPRGINAFHNRRSQVNVGVPSEGPP